ncbi:hypothetical protein EVAR_97096_1 [Eumeta japonica]|uniref:Uncharacterized protein n=1 Tax=Eumeta variegata TaxID=151549 RepID=A0A4C1X6A6_EUMVA|nr:hypothetical protein EVAR_97096_1 [Eumeta japonica]
MAPTSDGGDLVGTGSALIPMNFSRLLSSGQVSAYDHDARNYHARIVCNSVHSHHGREAEMRGKVEPDLRHRPVALFRDCNTKRLGIRFSSITEPRSVSISLGLAVLPNASTFSTSMKRKALDALSLMDPGADLTGAE